MNFLGQLGIDYKILIAQIINFVILLWILKRFVYKSIVQSVERNEKELQEARLLKEQLAKDRAAFEAEKGKTVAAARIKADSIIDEAEHVAEKIKEKEAEEMDEEKKKVIKQIKERLTDLSNEKE